MSGYHRISKLKSCLISLKSLKNINKLNDTLSKEINALCSKAKTVQDSTDSLEKIKELNSFLTKEFSNATRRVKSGSSTFFNIANENVKSCKNKFEGTCRPLYSLPDAIEEKKGQYKRKFLKSKHIRKEAEKLCQHLTKRQVYGATFSWSAAGLTLQDDKGTLAASKAVQNQAATVLDTAYNTDNISTLVETSLKCLDKQPGALSSPSVLDKEFGIHISETADIVDTGPGENAPVDSVMQSTYEREFRPDATANNVDTTLEGKAPPGTLIESSYERNVHLETLADNVDAASGENDSADFHLENAGAVVDVIPEPPAIPDLSAEALNQLNALGEPTFASLGLGGWSPVGMVQNCMEYLHVSLGLDWWVAIVLGTVIIRICLFPLVVLAQRNAAKMNNYMPQIQMLQMKMTEARQTGDSLNAARYSQELMLYMKEKGLNPLKNMIVPLAQAPVFVSFFMGLRQMANVPVDSLRTGGISWFTDLTLPDQYYILPIVTSATLWLTVEMGTDSAKLSAQNMVLMKYALRALPIIIFPFTLNFPGVILCYWVSSNFISLAQVAFLRIPSVREYFKIERTITFTADQLPAKKGFTEGIKDSWTNMKITRELEERRRLDQMQFQRAGKGPVQKTYKHDPTKQSTPGSQAPISAKKR